jgi:hypothetical protein
LIAAGILDCIRTVQPTKETHAAKIGSPEVSRQDRETVNVPTRAGVGAIVVGTILPPLPKKS